MRNKFEGAKSGNFVWTCEFVTEIMCFRQSVAGRRPSVRGQEPWSDFQRLRAHRVREDRVCHQGQEDPQLRKGRSDEGKLAKNRLKMIFAFLKILHFYSPTQPIINQNIVQHFFRFSGYGVDRTNAFQGYEESWKSEKGDCHQTTDSIVPASTTATSKQPRC